MAWLSSRGKFMFLHCIATDTAVIKLPWRKYRRHGNSLFLFRIIVGLVGLLFTAILCGIIFLLYLQLRPALSGTPVPFVLSLVLVFVIAFPIFIALAIFIKFTYDFVVPIMYLHNCTVTAAWKAFRNKIMSTNKGNLLLYLLFQIVINLAIGIIVLAVMLITCCIAACIMAIPYIGTVLLLPILAFKRSYSLFYLRQFGPDYDVFTASAVQEAQAVA